MLECRDAAREPGMAPPLERFWQVSLVPDVFLPTQPPPFRETFDERKCACIQLTEWLHARA
jgi:hypothetical protein